MRSDLRGWYVTLSQTPLTQVRRSRFASSAELGPASNSNECVRSAAKIRFRHQIVSISTPYKVCSSDLLVTPHTSNPGFAVTHCTVRTPNARSRVGFRHGSCNTPSHPPQSAREPVPAPEVLVAPDEHGRAAMKPAYAARPATPTTVPAARHSSILYRDRTRAARIAAADRHDGLGVGPGIASEDAGAEGPCRAHPATMLCRDLQT